MRQVGVAQLVKRFHAGEFTTGASSETPTETRTEEGYKQLWLSISPTQSPFSMALQAGMLADRLSWVFIAGYQSAQRACFADLPEHAWVSFAVSEDRTGEVPGTTLDGNVLRGTKTWVASVDLTDFILVGTPGDDGLVCMLVDARDPGVSLLARKSAGFLGEMSQGSATFDDVKIDPSQFRSSERVKDFGLAEPFFILTAACGFVMRESLRLSDTRLSEEVVEVAYNLETLSEGGFANDVEQLLAIQNRFVEIGKRCGQAQGGSTDWKHNGRLLGLYRKALQKRVAA